MGESQVVPAEWSFKEKTIQKVMQTYMNICTQGALNNSTGDLAFRL